MVKGPPEATMLLSMAWSTCMRAPKATASLCSLVAARLYGKTAHLSVWRAKAMSPGLAEGTSPWTWPSLLLRVWKETPTLSW